MRIIMIADSIERYECPKCGSPRVDIPVWDDDPYSLPEPSPVEDGECLADKCGFKGYRMDFDPTGKMARLFLSQI